VIARAGERDRTREEPQATAAADASPSRPRVVSSKELLGEAGHVHIEHDSEIYSLRRTRNGRLILTK
jgi:hemin uptake protein HemP